MVTRDHVQAVAREAIGTPYGHCGRSLDKTLDCIGLLVVVAERCGLPTGGHDCSRYSRIPRDNLIVRELELAGLRIVDRDPLPGDVGIFWISETKRQPQPQHAAIFTLKDNELSIVHSYSRVKRVVETTYDEYWEKRLFCVMTFPGVE